MRIALLLSICAGCFYNPGSYANLTSPFVGKRVALPCLDLAVAQTGDALARGSVVAYSFGNRCFHEIHVDLSTVEAVGYDEAGLAHRLHPYDPKRELRVLQLDALWKGDEQIEYLADDTTIVGDVCIDVAGIDRSAVSPARWVCL